MKHLRNIAYCVAATVAIYATPSIAQVDVATPVNSSANSTITPGAAFVSPDGRFRLTFQSDGNFVLYQGSTVLWDINHVINPTATPLLFAKNVRFQGDGNLVVYYFRGSNYDDEVPIWESGTDGNSNSSLRVQNDGNVVIYNSKGKAIWRTNTCCH